MSEQTFAAGIITGTITGAIMGIVPALIVICILVLFDLITGVWASLKLKIKIESHRLRATVFKLLSYLSITTLAGLIDGAITAEWRLSGFVGGFIAIVELMSIVENFGKITGNDLFEKLKDALGNKHESHHHINQHAH